MRKYIGGVCLGFKVFCFLSTILLLFSGCTSAVESTGNYNSGITYEQPILSNIMKNAIAYEGVQRNPVIVIHGFLGSKLKNIKTNKCIWGNFDIYSAFAGYSNEELKGLSYPMILNKAIGKIPDNAVSTSIMQFADVRIAGMNFNIDAYAKLLTILQGKGYVIEGEALPENKKFYSLFVFHYDWRKDLVANSALLHEFILQKKKYLQNQYKKNYGISNYDVQFDLVAHSMGGLLSRYYIMYGDDQLPKDGSVSVPSWKGSKNVDKIVIIGTPNTGYLDTFRELLLGYSPVANVDPYPPAVTGTWATYYQMLPLISTCSIVFKDKDNNTEENVNIFNPELWIKYKWGLAGVDDSMLKILLPDVATKEQRRKIAIDHLTKCLINARQFTDSIKFKCEYPRDIKMYLFFGNAVLTRSKAFVDKTTGKVNFSEFDSGDGIVCASSALCDMREGDRWKPIFQSPIRWHTVTPLMAAHVGLTESTPFANIIGYYLLFDLYN